VTRGDHPEPAVDDHGAGGPDAPSEQDPGSRIDGSTTTLADASGTDVANETLALERLSYYLDDLFVVPGTRYRIGLDPLLGLLPGVGDVATATASAYIVARAAALGVPRATLARMLLVLVVDAVVGSLPLVGDVFDAVWKANRRNVRLLESRLDDPGGASGDRQYVLVATVAVTLLLVLVGVGTLLAVWWLVGRVGGI
jgi:hypothetical protein